jgi:Na+/H+ antiporter NhaA
VAGIGFTVPLLVAERAFATNAPLVAASELGLLLGSLLAFGVGAVLLVAVGRRLDRPTTGGDTTGEGGAEEPFIPW